MRITPIEYSDINKLFDRICTDLYDVSVALSVCSLFNILIHPSNKSKQYDSLYFILKVNMYLVLVGQIGQIYKKYKLIDQFIVKGKFPTAGSIAIVRVTAVRLPTPSSHHSDAGLSFTSSSSALEIFTHSSRAG